MNFRIVTMLSLTVLAASLLVGCTQPGPRVDKGDDSSVKDTVGGALADQHAQDIPPVDTGPPTSLAKRIDELTFAAPQQWASPIKAYNAAGNNKLGHWSFRRGIHDLVVHAGRLYIGYGDEVYDLGSVSPLKCRYFADPKSTDTTDEYDIDEEEITRYRHLGDELWLAGIDGTEDGKFGNVYTRPAAAAGKWTKLRTVPSGFNVLDVAQWKGALYAAGAGATPVQWANGNHWAHLWKSTDSAKTWSVIDKHWNDEEGEARWTALLPTKARLYVFGYQTKMSSTAVILPNAYYDGTSDPPSVTGLAGSHPFKTLLVRGVWPLHEDGGIVTGTDELEEPPASRAWWVEGDKVTELAPAKKGHLLDVSMHRKTNELLLMTRDGPLPHVEANPTPWTYRIWRGDKGPPFEQVSSFQSSSYIEAVAYWQGSLYYGVASGDVWRGPGVWKIPPN